MKILIKESQLHIITEATASEIHKKYYNGISDDDFNKIVSVDDISSNIETDKLGEYGKWLLNLYKKSSLKLEDLYKAKEYIHVFNKVKKLNKIENTDLNTYKSLSEMYKVIEPFMGKEQLSNKEKVKKIKTKDVDVVYEDDEWKVLIPKTHEASCLYGEHTQWCTASRNEPYYFETYSKTSPLYININKKSGRKYQFHFSDGQFMDETDESVNLSDLKLNQNLISFYSKLYPKYKFSFTYDSVGGFINGLARVTLNDEVNYINTEGKPISKIWFEKVLDFFEGIAIVRKDVEFSNPNTWNYINRDGKLLSKDWLERVYTFHNGHGVIQMNGLRNVIDDQGKIISKFWYEGMGNYEDGRLLVTQKGRCNFINEKGELISEKWYEDAVPFSNGISIVKRNGKYNLIDKNNVLLSKIWFDKVKGFQEELSGVVINDRYNYINRDGELLSSEWFDYCTDFVGKLGIVVQEKKNNFINKSGKITSKIWFDDIMNLDKNGNAKVKINEKYNFIKNGKELVSRKWYDYIGHLSSDGKLNVSDEGDRYDIDLEGNKIEK